MSQAKVDAHKQEKQNRKQAMIMAKRRRILIRVLLILIAIVVVAWIATSAYQYTQNNKETAVIPVNTSAITDYLYGE